MPFYQKDLVLVQRNDANTLYEQVNISGSDALLYLDNNGHISASKVSRFPYILASSSFSSTASYGLNFTASEGINIYAANPSTVGYIELYGGTVYGTSSWAVTASYASLSRTASYSNTSSFGLFALSSSYASTASFFDYITYTTTQSFTSTSISSSWASHSLQSFTSSWSSHSFQSSTSSWASYSLSSSLATNAVNIKVSETNEATNHYLHFGTGTSGYDAVLLNSSIYAVPSARTIAATSSWASNITSQNNFVTNRLTASYASISASVVIGSLYGAQAPLHVGDRTDNNSVDSVVLISRNVDDRYSGNGHAFSDSSVLDRSGYMSYNSFDSRVVYTGSNDYDHYAGFQTIPTYKFSGSLSHSMGFVAVQAIYGGTVHNMYGFRAQGVSKYGGTVVNNYGLYVDNTTIGTNRYGVYVVANNSYLGGNVGIKSLPTTSDALLVNGRITSSFVTASDGLTANYGRIPLLSVDRITSSFNGPNYLGVTGIRSLPFAGASLTVRDMCAITGSAGALTLFDRNTEPLFPWSIFHNATTLNFYRNLVSWMTLTSNGMVTATGFTGSFRGNLFGTSSLASNITNQDNIVTNRLTASYASITNDLSTTTVSASSVRVSSLANITDLYVNKITSSFNGPNYLGQTGFRMLPAASTTITIRDLAAISGSSAGLMMFDRMDDVNYPWTIFHNGTSLNFYRDSTSWMTLKSDGNIVATGLSGSLFGSASWATNALTSSLSDTSSISTNADNIKVLSTNESTDHYLHFGTGTSGYDTVLVNDAMSVNPSARTISITSSWATNLVGGVGTSLTTASTYPITSSWAVYVPDGNISHAGLADLNSSGLWHLTDEQYGDLTNGVLADASTLHYHSSDRNLENSTGILPIARLTGSYAITSSWATTSSLALTASLAPNYQLLLTTASLYPFTSSWSVTSSLALTASLAPNYQPLIVTASLMPVTSSWAITSSRALTASLASTSSYAAEAVKIRVSSTDELFDHYIHFGTVTSGYDTVLLNSGLTVNPYTKQASVTSSWSNISLTASLAPDYQLLIATSSLMPVTSSWAITSSMSLTSSLAITASVAITASYATKAKITARPADALFFQTGSVMIKGDTGTENLLTGSGELLSMNYGGLGTHWEIRAGGSARTTNASGDYTMTFAIGSTSMTTPTTAISGGAFIWRFDGDVRFVETGVAGSFIGNGVFTFYHKTLSRTYYIPIYLDEPASIDLTAANPLELNYQCSNAEHDITCSYAVIKESPNENIWFLA